jgi:S1-C subfamily serine protease
MNALGPIAKVAAAFIGKQPEDELITRGYLGVELDMKPGTLGVRVARVLPDSPAAKGSLRVGDLITRVGDRDLVDVVSARNALRKVKPGDRVLLTVQRDGEPAGLKLTVTAGEGF